MADSKSGGMAQAQKEKIDNKLLEMNKLWINDVNERVEAGKIPKDVGDKLIEKINTNIQRIKSSKTPIIDNIEFLKGNAEVGESETKIKITFNKATQKTQMEEFEKKIKELNDSREAQQIGTITYDEKNNTIELFRIPPLQKVEVELEVVKQEVPISTSAVPVEEIQKSTEAILTNIKQMQEVADEIAKKAESNKNKSWWKSFKESLKTILSEFEYVSEPPRPLTQPYEDKQKLLSTINNLVEMHKKLKQQYEETNAQLEKEKGENKEKIEKLVVQQQKLMEQIDILQKRLDELNKQKPKPKPTPKPGEQEKKSTDQLSGQSVSGATKSTSSKIYSLSFSDPKVKKDFEKRIQSEYKNELVQLVSPNYISTTLSFDTQDSKLAELLGFNDKTQIGSKYKYTLSYQKINVVIEIEWKGDNNFVITLIK